MPPDTDSPRPPSASPVWTGPLGLLAAVAGLFVLAAVDIPLPAKTATLIAWCCVPMLAAEAIARRHAWNFGRHRIDLTIVARKTAAVWLCLGAIALACWLLPIYADPFYAPFTSMLQIALPALLVATPFYIAATDALLGTDPDDPYLQLARLFCGKPPSHWCQLRTLAAGWVVKGFFLPLMFCFLAGDLAGLWSTADLRRLTSFPAVYAFAYDLLYLFDVLLASIGYLATLRLFGTGLRSVEPTAFGWLVCLACYPPFWSVLGASYFAYDQDELYWGEVFAGSTALYTIWGTAILLLVAIYLWATVSFGLRFSNLTHRGIITHGPYRWVKHPAYLAKNASWWLVSVPFIAGSGWETALRSCLLLAGVNLLYLLRARTEERHLSRDPAYRDYQRYIARHGLAARLRRRIAVIPPQPRHEIGIPRSGVGELGLGKDRQQRQG